MASKVIFITGKGGVGKSSFASLLSVFLAENGVKTNLISIDAAHSLSLLFKIPKCEEKYTINDNLILWEPNIDDYLKKYIEKSKIKIKKSFKYLSGYAIEHLVDLISISPGAYEQAIWEIIADDIINNNDLLIIDAPPSGESVRILSLPFIMSKWIKSVYLLKKDIVELSSAEQNIKGEVVKDNNELEVYDKYKNKYENLLKIIQNNCDIIVVTDDSYLANREFEFLSIKTKALNLKISFKVINNRNNKKISNREIEHKIIVPYLEEMNGGYDVFCNIVKSYSYIFDDFLTMLK